MVFAFVASNSISSLLLGSHLALINMQLKNTCGYIIVTSITYRLFVKIRLEKKKDTIAKHYKDGKPVQLREISKKYTVFMSMG